MILITGATGNVGSQVARELAVRGVAARAFVRDGTRARELLGDGVGIVEGDFADLDSLRRALAGAEKVFVSSVDGPDKVAHETAVIDAAAAAGVQLLVKCSTIGAKVGRRRHRSTGTGGSRLRSGARACRLSSSGRAST